MKLLPKLVSALATILPATAAAGPSTAEYILARAPRRQHAFSGI
ncbi:hypothetical protein OAI26_08870 [Sulfitobacter sp.]|nr:hypothetical protein [Sulfitobacter sp.]